MPTIPWPWSQSKGTATTNDDTSGHNLAQTSSSSFPELAKHVPIQLDTLPAPLLALTAFALGAATATSTALVYARYGRRLRNSDWLTPDIFARRRWIRGVVTAVGDGDNFRLYHTPAFGWAWPIKFRRVPSATKDLKDETLHIRIAGVDAPEAAHFGRPAQPYSAESLAWLREKILGKVVYCQPIQRDQYSRIVANVTLAPRILPGYLATGKPLSLEMLRAGWATTYEQTGAEYGSWGKDEFLRIENEAKRERRGMWAKGVGAETPAEYKRRHAAAATPEEAEAARSRKEGQQKTQSGWLRRLLGR